jgi:K(+)-stimulated pyrophosphate-energized sodium pump
MDLIPIILGFLGLLTAYVLYVVVKKYPAGDKNLTDISDEIHLGAMAFMKKEYTILFMFSVILVLGNIYRTRP